MSARKQGEMIILISVFVTLTAASMTSVAAWDRGGTIIDKGLLVAMSIVIVLAVHLLPALSRRPATWLVWAGCLLCAIYGHLTFLTHASMRAGDDRAQKSMIVVGTERQIELATNALAGIKARPVALVAAVLAKSSDRRERAALREEIVEGRRAEAIRDELRKLAEVSTSAKISEAADPVTARISLVIGWSESAVSVIIGLTFSMLLELIGALVWVESLRPSRVSATTYDRAVTPITDETTDVTQPVTRETIHVTTDVTGNETTPVTDHETDAVKAIKRAIELGKCKGTVSGIREFLGCSQSRAQKLRRELVTCVT